MYPTYMFYFNNNQTNASVQHGRGPYIRPVVWYLPRQFMKSLPRVLGGHSSYGVTSNLPLNRKQYRKDDLCRTQLKFNSDSVQSYFLMQIDTMTGHLCWK